MSSTKFITSCILKLALFEENVVHATTLRSVISDYFKFRWVLNMKWKTSISNQHTSASSVISLSLQPYHTQRRYKTLKEYNYITILSVNYYPVVSVSSHYTYDHQRIFHVGVINCANTMNFSQK